MATGVVTAQVNVNGTRVDHASFSVHTGTTETLTGEKTLLVVVVKSLVVDDEITAELFPGVGGSGTWDGAVSDAKLTAIKIRDVEPA